MRSKDNNRFWELELDDSNIKDMDGWVKNNELVGLVDEDNGGIIGYINRKHIGKIAEKLNKKCNRWLK